MAELVKLNSRELTEVWNGPPKSGKPDSRHSDKNHKNDSYQRIASMGYSPESSSNYAPRPRPGGRTAPASRADHAARILLTHMASWESLSNEDRHLLCAPPAPHGPLFVWLESQLHEHGAQPWAALREGLREHESETLALKATASFEVPLAGEPALDDTASELRGLLDLMLADRFMRQENEALAANDLERYRRLQYQRLALGKAKNSSTGA